MVVVLCGDWWCGVVWCPRAVCAFKTSQCVFVNRPLLSWYSNVFRGFRTNMEVAP